MANLNIIRPQAGQQVALESLEHARLVLAFPPADATLERVGEDLVFKFEDGGQVALTGFYKTYTSENMPTFEIEGAEVSGKDFFVALGEDLMPAAGPAAAAVTSGGRYNEFGNDALMSGVDRLGGLDIGFNNAVQTEDNNLGGIGDLGGADTGLFGALGGATTGPSDPAGPSDPVTPDPGPSDPVNPDPGTPEPPIDPPLPPINPGDLAGLKLGSVYEGALSGGTGKHPDFASGLTSDQTSTSLNGLPPDWTVVGGGNAYGNLVQDPDTGAWRYELTDSTQEHSGNTGYDSATGKVDVVLRDPYGREVTVEVDVDIVDDAPLDATSDTTAKEQEDHSYTADGKIYLKFGADDMHADFAISLDGWNGTKNNDGSWTFTKDGAELVLTPSPTGGTEWNYTITSPTKPEGDITGSIMDKDGDKADIGITIKTDSLVDMNAEQSDTSLNTSDKVVGADGKDSDSGNLTFSAPDGFGSITIAGKELTWKNGQWLDSDNNVVTEVSNPNGPGSLTLGALTGSAEGGYTIDYTYTQNKGFTGHKDENSTDETAQGDKFEVVIKDANGDMGNANITVTIEDDGPTLEVTQGQTVLGPTGNLDHFESLNFHDYVNGNIANLAPGSSTLSFNGVTVSAGHVRYDKAGTGGSIAISEFGEDSGNTFNKGYEWREDQFHGLSIGQGGYYDEIEVDRNYPNRAEAVQFKLDGLAYGIDLSLGCFFSEGAVDTAPEIVLISFYRGGKLVHSLEVSSDKTDGVFENGIFKQYITGGFDSVVLSPVHNGDVNNSSEFVIRNIGFETIPEPIFITTGTVKGDSGGDGFHTGNAADATDYTNASFNYKEGQELTLKDADGKEFTVTLKVGAGTAGGDGVVSAYDAAGNLIFKAVLDKDGNWSFNQYKIFTSADGGSDGKDDTFDLSFITKDKDGDTAIKDAHIDTAPSAFDPDVKGLDVTGGEVTVHEKDLPANGTGGIESPVKTFTIDAPGGIESATINGTTITNGAIIEGKYGDLIITGFTHLGNGQYEVNYKYALNDNIQHTPGDGANSTPAGGEESFTVAVKGKASGEVAEGTLDVTIVDDVPLVGDSSVMGSDTDQSVSGTIGLDAGADGYQSITVGDVTATWNANANEGAGGWEFSGGNGGIVKSNGDLVFRTGDQGKVQLDLETGEYTVQAPQGTLDQNTTIKVEVVDGDGDKASGNITVEVVRREEGSVTKDPLPNRDDVVDSAGNVIEGNANSNNLMLGEEEGGGVTSTVTVPANVCFAIDVSYSMNDGFGTNWKVTDTSPSRLTTLADSLYDAMKDLAPGTNMSLVLFSSKSETIEGEALKPFLEAANSPDSTKLADLLSKYVAHGTNGMGKGLEDATKWLQETAKEHPENSNSLVFITDATGSELNSSKNAISGLKDVPNLSINTVVIGNELQSIYGKQPEILEDMQNFVCPNGILSNAYAEMIIDLRPNFNYWNPLSDTSMKEFLNSEAGIQFSQQSALYNYLIEQGYTADKALTITKDALFSAVRLSYGGGWDLTATGTSEALATLMGSKHSDGILDIFNSITTAEKEYEFTSTPESFKDVLEGIQNSQTTNLGMVPGSDIMLGRDQADMLFGDSTFALLQQKVFDYMTEHNLVEGGMLATSLTNADIFKIISADPTVFDFTGTNDTTGDKADLLLGGAGHDILYGQGGNDVLIGDGSVAADNSTLAKLAEHLGLSDELAQALNVKGVEIADFNAKVVNAIQGMGKGDAANLVSFADWLEGKNGIEASTDGNDKLFGGTGDDVLFGGGGNDMLLGGAGDDILFGGSGNDYIDGGAGKDKIFGGSGNDLIKFDAADLLIDGGDDLDVLLGGTNDLANMKNMLTNGKIDNVELLVTGDKVAGLTNMDQLYEQLGITKNADGSLDLGQSWSQNDAGGVDMSGSQGYLEFTNHDGITILVQESLIKTDAGGSA